MDGVLDYSQFLRLVLISRSIFRCIHQIENRTHLDCLIHLVMQINLFIYRPEHRLFISYLIAFYLSQALEKSSYQQFIRVVQFNLRL